MARQYQILMQEWGHCPATNVLIAVINVMTDRSAMGCTLVITAVSCHVPPVMYRVTTSQFPSAEECRDVPWVNRCCWHSSVLCIKVCSQRSCRVTSSRGEHIAVQTTMH